MVVISATTGIVVRTWALPRILTYSEVWDVLEARQALAANQMRMMWGTVFQSVQEIYRMPS
jgi:hypothetical protein